jgi:hypothetical protein
MYTVSVSEHAPVEDAEIISAATNYLHADKVAGRCKLAYDDYGKHHAADSFSIGLRIALEYAQQRTSALRRVLLDALCVKYRETGETAFAGQIHGIWWKVEYYPELHLPKITQG